MCSSIYLVKRDKQRRVVRDRSRYLFREDAFQKEDNTYYDVRFEEACILYNLGAMYSRLGANESRRTSDVRRPKNYPSNPLSVVFV